MIPTNAVNPAFDRLTNEQKIWSLNKVAYGLLDKKTEAVLSTACLDATVAAIFRAIEKGLDCEIYQQETTSVATDASIITNLIILF